MTARFMNNTKYANTEFEMQLIPGFTPRRSGMSVSRFEYSARDCDCSACAYQGRKKKMHQPHPMRLPAWTACDGLCPL